jgi:hypothetical protein
MDLKQTWLEVAVAQCRVCAWRGRGKPRHTCQDSRCPGGIESTHLLEQGRWNFSGKEPQPLQGHVRGGGVQA